MRDRADGVRGERPRPQWPDAPAVYPLPQAGEPDPTGFADGAVV